jgi:hypothetical protein
MAETEKIVNSTKKASKPAALGQKGYPPTGPNPLAGVPVDGKRQTGPAAMDYPFA